MIKAGVIGHPIAHSKSPVIHGYWLKKYGIDGEYQRYDISPETLKDGIEKLVADGVRGFNVTIPHKQSVAALCETLSDEARAIGAVNTVIVNADGTLHGHNTDAFGFMRNLKVTVPSFSPTETTALIIGAGGAAKAVRYALAVEGVKAVRITNRTRESAEQLAEKYPSSVYDWDKRRDAVTGANLVINTTSLGMTGQPPLSLSLEGLAPNAIVYDIVYVPLMTDLLREAERVGGAVVTGIGMLLHQACPGFEVWFGRKPEVTKELESLLL